MSLFAWNSFNAQMRTVGLDGYFNFNFNDSHNTFLQNFKSLWLDNAKSLAEVSTRGQPTPVPRVLNYGALRSTDYSSRSLLDDDSRLMSIQAGLRTDHKFPVTMKVFTWNLGGRKPLPYQALHWLVSVSKPDLLVFAFQEIVSLNLKGAIVPNSVVVAQWHQSLSGALRVVEDNEDPYIHIKAKSMFGCYISVFAKASIASDISNIDSYKVKTGLGSTCGNKGSVMVRFNISTTSICIWNCHLPTGNTAVETRCRQLEYIAAKGFAKRTTPSSINDHDGKILLGDLNFRIDLSNSETRSLASTGNVQRLIDHDQLLKVKDRHCLLRQYREMPITFLPTYKYDLCSDQYDTSKKQRTPAYCDRILVSGNQVRARSYSRVEHKHSDHRPVCAWLEITGKQQSSEGNAGEFRSSKLASAKSKASELEYYSLAASLKTTASERDTPLSF
jgi:endonuclease/exonuclease/phosphatase family metal-dependent hydrolase